MQRNQSFPECYPEDGWNTVTYLDNSQSNTETDFKFTQSIGIEILQLNFFLKNFTQNTYKAFNIWKLNIIAIANSSEFHALLAYLLRTSFCVVKFLTLLIVALLFQELLWAMKNQRVARLT